MLPQGPIITANFAEVLATTPIRSELRRSLHDALAGLHFTRAWMAARLSGVLGSVLG
jgi:hypothetical protein